MELITGVNDSGRRLDRILRKALPNTPLPLLHRLLRQKKVTVNGEPKDAQYRPGAGEIIVIPVEQIQKTPPPKRFLDSPLEIIWEDSSLLAVNKPAGIEVHGKNSLDAMVRSYLADKLPSSLSFTPGPLHRLDKPTSGIVIFSKSINGARLFSSLLQEQKVFKTYLAIIEGVVDKEQVWEDELVRDREKKKTFIVRQKLKESKTAGSILKPVCNNGSFSLVTVKIITGRTHQIRAQAAFHGHPLYGDRKYSNKGDGRFFLHSWKTEFLDVSIKAPPPLDFIKKTEELFPQGRPFL